MLTSQENRAGDGRAHLSFLQGAISGAFSPLTAALLSQAFNGAGEVWTPTVINLFCFWLWQLPLAYGLAHWLQRGPAGLFAAIMIAWSTYAVVGAVMFKRGRWKLKKV